MIGGRPGDDAKTLYTLDREDLRGDLREAYEHGRRDERARRRRHPVGMTITFALAIVGVIILALAVVNGSFGRAGQVVDNSLAMAADRAAPAASQAAANAGQSLKGATDTARAKASNLAG